MAGLSDYEPLSQTSPDASARKNGGLKWITLAVASSLIASTCCVLPLVLVLAGITGAWISSLAALRPLTPVFYILSIGTVSWAAYLIFRPANSCSVGDGSACSENTPFVKWAFAVSAFLIALVLLFPLAAPLFY
jgi:mercuric ion transport protein